MRDPIFAPARCLACGEELHLTPCSSEDAFEWTGADGSTRCPAKAWPAELGDQAWWDDIRDKTRRGVVEAPSEPWWAKIEGGCTDDVAARYSALSAALNLGWHPWGKAHDREGGQCLNPLGMGTWCHGQPLRWAPSGWVCRVPSAHSVNTR